MTAEPGHAAGWEEPTAAGHKLYMPLFLRIYDPLVLGFYSNRVWRCPLSRLIDNYTRHIGRRHLDVGPGTGYFLRRAQLPMDVDLTLLDPNPHVLGYTTRRLGHLNPVAVQADVCEPLPVSPLFDSAGLNYVLHCLPGPPSRKAHAVGNLAAVLKPDGVLFGATILGERHLHTPFSRAALWNLNRSGVFDNRSDSVEALRSILAASFDHVTVDVIGAAAIFTARAPRREQR